VRKVVTVWFKSYSDLIDFLILIRKLDENSELWNKIVDEHLENVRIFRETFDEDVEEFEVKITFAHDILPIRDIQIYAHTPDNVIDVAEWADAVDP
jgi:hypothetical protein